MTGPLVFDAADRGGPLKRIRRGHGSDEGYVYVLSFDCGRVKVGRTIDPWTRVDELSRRARRRGATVLSGWVSVPHLGMAQTEDTLLSWCRSEAAAEPENEYFTGLTFNQVVQQALSLRYPDYTERVEQIALSLDEVAVVVGVPASRLWAAAAELRFAHIKFGADRLMTQDQISALRAAITAGVIFPEASGRVPALTGSARSLPPGGRAT